MKSRRGGGLAATLKLVACAVIVVAATACGDSRRPRAHAGRYDLVAVGGQPLPVATMNPYAPCGERILGGFVVLGGDGSFAVFVQREQIHSSGARAPIRTDTARGTYRLSGAEVLVRERDETRWVPFGFLARQELRASLMARTVGVQPLPEPGACYPPALFDEFRFARAQ